MVTNVPMPMYGFSFSSRQHGLWPLATNSTVHVGQSTWPASVQLMYDSFIQLHHFAQVSVVQYTLV